MSETGQRIEWIDIAKAIGILLVILGHTEIPNFLHDAIYSFHLFLFFFISGLTLKKIPLFQFSSFLKKKVLTLIVPYIGFSAIIFAFWFFVRRNFGQSGIETLPVKDVLWQIFMGQTSLNYATPAWFLTCLFCTEILFFFLLQIKNQKILAVICICSTIMGTIYSHMANIYSLPRLFWNVDYMFFFLGYLALGYFFTQANLTKYFKRPSQILTATICSLVAFLGLSYLKTAYSFPYSDLILDIPLAVLGLWTIIGLSLFIKKNKLLSLCGKNTLAIFSLHLITFSLIKGLLIIKFHVNPIQFQDAFIINLIMAILTLFITLPMALLIKQFAPILVGRKTDAPTSLQKNF